VVGPWGDVLCDTGYFGYSASMSNGPCTDIAAGVDGSSSSSWHEQVDPVDGSLVRVARAGQVGKALNDPTILSTSMTIKLERFSATIVNDIMGLDQPLIALALRDVSVDMLQYHYANRMLARASLELEAEYYNEQMAIWEPLIEAWRLRAYSISPKPLAPNPMVGQRALQLAKEAMLRHPLTVSILSQSRSATMGGSSSASEQLRPQLMAPEDLVGKVIALANGTGDAEDELHSLPVALGWALFALEDSIQAEAARYE